MALYLVIEASAEPASVAVVERGAAGVVLRVEEDAPSRDGHGRRVEGIAPAIARCLAQVGVSARQLDGIVCSRGPGGFTSLRSAASVAKGMCGALGLPLYAVETFALMVAGLGDGRYLPILDAGRGEWYGAFVRVEQGQIVDVDPVAVGVLAVMEQLASRAGAVIVGQDGGRTLRAGAVVSVLNHILAGGPVDLALWEPSYGRLPEAQAKWEVVHGRPLQG